MAQAPRAPVRTLESGAPQTDLDKNVAAAARMAEQAAWLSWQIPETLHPQFRTAAVIELCHVGLSACADGRVTLRCENWIAGVSDLELQLICLTLAGIGTAAKKAGKHFAYRLTQLFMFEIAMEQLRKKSDPVAAVRCFPASPQGVIAAPNPDVLVQNDVHVPSPPAVTVNTPVNVKAYPARSTETIERDEHREMARVIRDNEG